MSRTLKILFLDRHTAYLPNLSDRGITIEVTHERLWSPDVYKSGPETLTKISELTAAGNFDLVVLGNNVGAGAVKATAIHQRLHSRTVVVWHEADFAGKAEYERLGLKKFMTRSCLRDYIVNLVTN